MAEVAAVLWHLDTMSNAPTVPFKDKWDKAVNMYNTDPAFRDQIHQMVTQYGGTLQDAVGHVAQGWWEKANPRSEFTRLSPAARLKQLGEAVKAGREWASRRGSPNMVFVAPEYLFAQSGYSHLLDGSVHLDSIRKGIQSISKQHPHSLVFPGTVAYRMPFDGHSVRARVDLLEDTMFWQRQGKPKNANGNVAKFDRIVMRDPSLKMARNTTYAYLNGQKVLEYSKRGDYHEVTSMEDDGQTIYVSGSRVGVVRAFGLRFGMEVCLDHVTGYARRSGGDEYDVHVIAAASVDPVPANEYVIGRNPGQVGFVVHADPDPPCTHVLRWEGGTRSEVPSVWDSAAGNGRLFGYVLDFAPSAPKQPVGGQTGQVAKMKLKFGG